MPMGSGQNDPTNLLGWEPWLRATRRGGGCSFRSARPPFCSWTPAVIGTLQATGQCSQLLVVQKLVGSWPYLESQPKMGK